MPYTEWAGNGVGGKVVGVGSASICFHFYTNSHFHSHLVRNNLILIEHFLCVKVSSILEVSVSSPRKVNRKSRMFIPMV